MTVNYAFIQGTATSGADYVYAQGTATIPAGSTGTNVFADLLDDAIDEPNETVYIVISNPVNGTILQASGTSTIVDDEGIPSIRASDVTVSEGETGNVYVTVSGLSSYTITVNFVLQNTTATS